MSAPARVAGPITVGPAPPALTSLSWTEYSAELPSTASSWSTLPGGSGSAGVCSSRRLIDERGAFPDAVEVPATALTPATPVKAVLM